MIPAIIALIGVLSGALILFTKEGRKGAAVFITNLVGGALDIAVPVVEDVSGLLDGIVAAFVAAFKEHGGAIATNLKTPMEDMARAAFAAVTGPLIAKGTATPDKWRENAADAMADAFGLGFASFGVSAAFEAAFPEKLNVLNGAGPMLATMAGFAEVSGAALGPLMETAIKKPAQYDLNSKFRPNLPVAGQAVEMYARGIIGRDLATAWLAYAGFQDSDMESLLQSGYRPLQPRMLLRAMELGIFSDAELTDVMTFSAMRPADQDRIIRAAKALAVEPYRQRARQAIVSAYERGLYTDEQLSSFMADLGLPDGAETYVHMEAAARKLVQLTAIYETSISDAYHYGQVSDADYVPMLERSGIAAADAEARYSRDAIKKTGRAALAAVRAEEQEKRRLTREQSQLALKQYAAGATDLAGLSAQLLTAGVPLVEIPITVALAQTRQAGSLVKTYDQLLPRADATLLREKVAALNEQTVKKLLTADQAIAQLRALGIGEKYAAALAAKWAAQAYATVLPV